MDCSEVAERLFVGSHPETDPCAHGFTLLVLTAKSLQDCACSTVPAHLSPLTDDAFSIRDGDIDRCREAADKCVKELRAGGKVLVTCREGLNRSAWVAARAMLTLGDYGQPAAVIERVQSLRDGALYNWFFQQELKGLPLRRPLS